MHPTNWPSFQTVINIDMISPKQLLGECLDQAAIMLKEVIEVYCNINKIQQPFVNQKSDFSVCASYILDAARFDKIVECFVKEDLQSKKPLIRTWLFQLKSIRNVWAHWPPENIDIRLGNRAFDTLSLLFHGFSGNTGTQLFAKIEFYPKSYHLQMEQQKKY